MNGQPSASRSKRKGKSSVPKSRKSDMLDSVVKAVGMAAEAATEVGTLLASANTFMQVGERPRTRTAGEVNGAKKKVIGAGSRKAKATPKKQATRKSKGRVAASPKTIPLTVSKNVSKKNDVAARRKTVKDDKSRGKLKSPKTQRDSRQPALPAKSTLSHRDLVEARDGRDANEKSEHIARGSTVEVKDIILILSTSALHADITSRCYLSIIHDCFPCFPSSPECDYY